METSHQKHGFDASKSWPGFPPVLKYGFQTLRLNKGFLVFL